MNRRGFIGALAGAFAMDPERALWVPGARLISIPRPRVEPADFADWRYFADGDVITIQGFLAPNGELQRFRVTKVAHDGRAIRLTPYSRHFA